MLGRGILIGAVVTGAALMLVPGVAAATARAARPLVRGALKQGAVAAEKLRQSAAEAYEHFEDLAAEVRAETGFDGAHETGAEANEPQQG